MTQHVPISSSKLRKGFIIAVFVLLIMGFFFFYLASITNWDYITIQDENVQVGYPSSVSNYGFGDSYVYPVPFPTTEMQHNDYLTIDCILNQTISNQTAANQTVYVILFGATPANTTVLSYQAGFLNLSYTNQLSLSYTNHDSLKSVTAYFAIPSDQNLTSTTASFTLNLNHYDSPNWFDLGVGVLLCSIALDHVVLRRRIYLYEILGACLVFCVIEALLSFETSNILQSTILEAIGALLALGFLASFLARTITPKEQTKNLNSVKQQRTN